MTKSEKKIKERVEDAVADLNKQGADLSYPVDKDGHIKAFTPQEFGNFFKDMQDAYNRGDLTFKNETKEEIAERKRAYREKHRDGL